MGVFSDRLKCRSEMCAGRAIGGIGRERPMDENAMGVAAVTTPNSSEVKNFHPPETGRMGHPQRLEAAPQFAYLALVGTRNVPRLTLTG